MTIAAVLEFVAKYWKWLSIGLVVLVFGIYVGVLKHTITKKEAVITSDQATIADRDRQIADLKGAIVVQNQAIAQMERYAEEKERKIADATALSEKLQDEIDLKAEQILTRDTKIAGATDTLADCQSQVARIKAYLLNAEGEIREGLQK